MRPSGSSSVSRMVVPKKEARNWGHTFVAIRPDALVDDFDAKASSICAAVKASGPSVRIPGESSAKTAAARVAADELPIPAKIWASIQHTAANGI